MPNQFKDLRELLINKLNLDFFGECGGMGRCVTCLCCVLRSNDSFSLHNEAEFACQIKIDSKLNDCVVEVIGDRLRTKSV